MKTALYKNTFAALLIGAALISGYSAQAQYPAASVLLSTHNLEHYSINSSDDYASLEENINTLASRLREAHRSYPNLQYTPSYNENGEIAGFVITGVSDPAAANEVSYYLMQLEVLGEVAMTVNENYLPSSEDAKLSRVSKKRASM